MAKKLHMGSSSKLLEFSEKLAFQSKLVDIFRNSILECTKIPLIHLCRHFKLGDVITIKKEEKLCDFNDDLLVLIEGEIEMDIGNIKNSVLCLKFKLPPSNNNKALLPIIEEEQDKETSLLDPKHKLYDTNIKITLKPSHIFGIEKFYTQNKHNNKCTVKTYTAKLIKLKLNYLEKYLPNFDINNYIDYSWLLDRLSTLSRTMNMLVLSTLFKINKLPANHVLYDDNLPIINNKIYLLYTGSMLDVDTNRNISKGSFINLYTLHGKPLQRVKTIGECVVFSIDYQVLSDYVKLYSPKIRVPILNSIQKERLEYTNEELLTHPLFIKALYSTFNIEDKKKMECLRDCINFRKEIHSKTTSILYEAKCIQIYFTKTNNKFIDSFSLEIITDILQKIPYNVTRSLFNSAEIFIKKQILDSIADFKSTDYYNQIKNYIRFDPKTLGRNVVFFE